MVTSKIVAVTPKKQKHELLGTKETVESLTNSGSRFSAVTSGGRADGRWNVMGGTIAADWPHLPQSRSTEPHGSYTRICCRQPTGRNSRCWLCRLAVGFLVGFFVGFLVGFFVGFFVGFLVGFLVGFFVGAAFLAANVGLAVGCKQHTQASEQQQIVQRRCGDGTGVTWHLRRLCISSPTCPCIAIVGIMRFKPSMTERHLWSQLWGRLGRRLGRGLGCRLGRGLSCRLGQLQHRGSGHRRGR